MGRASRSRRRSAQQSAPSGDTPSSSTQVRLALRDLLGEAFVALDHGDVHRFDDVAATIAALCAEPGTHRTVVLALLDSLTMATTEAWQRGWQPADVHRLVGRRLGPAEQEVVVDVMSHELERYPASTLDRHWIAQLRELDGLPRDGRGAPRSTTWLEERRAAGTDWFTLVSRSVALLHLVARLPILERLTALPGEAPPRAAEPASDGPVADERILSRVRMLLAKAESTPFEAEAETFTAGAQSLMARHSIDAALLARAGHDRTGGRGSDPQGRRIGIDNPYEGPKAALLQVVASANRCRMVWSRELGFGTIVGFESDVDGVEVLFTSLLVQATRTLAAAGSRTDPHGGSRTRSFRQSFLAAFADRIGERLREATAQEEVAAADRTNGRELVPILTARAREVDDMVDTWFPDVRRASFGSARDAEGWHSGRSAADRAELGSARRLPD